MEGDDHSLPAPYLDWLSDLGKAEDLALPHLLLSYLHTSEGCPEPEHVNQIQGDLRKHNFWLGT